MAEKNPELAWARDIIAVYNCAGKALPGNASASRKALHAWVTDEEAGNKTELFTKLVPKAIEIINRYSKDDTEDEITRVERKSIAELRALIKETIQGA